MLRLGLQTGLGQGAFRTRCLRPEAIARTVDAVREFAAEAVELGSASIQVLATSAMRETANGQEFARAITKRHGLEFRVISGEEEADCVFEGVSSDPAIGLRPALIVKVGGGSTEWVLGESGLVFFRKSTPIGTVRLLEFQPPGNPPARNALARLRATVSEFLPGRGQSEPRAGVAGVLRSGDSPRRPGRFAACAGTTRAQVAGFRPLQFAPRASNSSNKSSESGNSPVQQRRQLKGLDPQQAEVILPGGVLYEAVLDKFGFDEVLISSRGLREGALLRGPAKPDHRRFGLAETTRVSLARPGRWELSLLVRQAH